MATVEFWFRGRFFVVGLGVPDQVVETVAWAVSLNEVVRSQTVSLTFVVVLGARTRAPKETFPGPILSVTSLVHLSQQIVIVSRREPSTPR